MSLANCMQTRHEDDDYDVDAESSLSMHPKQKKKINKKKIKQHPSAAHTKDKQGLIRDSGISD